MTAVIRAAEPRHSAGLQPCAAARCRTKVRMFVAKPRTDVECDSRIVRHPGADLSDAWWCAGPDAIRAARLVADRRGGEEVAAPVALPLHHAGHRLPVRGVNRTRFLLQLPSRLQSVRHVGPSPPNQASISARILRCLIVISASCAAWGASVGRRPSGTSRRVGGGRGATRRCTPNAPARRRAGYQQGPPSPAIPCGSWAPVFPHLLSIIGEMRFMLPAGTAEGGIR